MPSGGCGERSWSRHSALGGKGEKGLLFAQEGSRHWGPCPGAAGELLARWRAAGGWGGAEEGFQAQPSASSSQPPPSSWAGPRPKEGQPPLPPRYRTSKGSPGAEGPTLQKPPGFGPSTLGRLLPGRGSPGLCPRTLSRVRLFSTPRTVAPHAPLCMGFSRQEYWSGSPRPPPGDLPTQGSNLRLLRWQPVSWLAMNKPSLGPSEQLSGEEG